MATDLSAALADFKRDIALDNVNSRLEGGEGSLGRLLSTDDGQLYEDGKTLMANLRTISQNLADGKGTLGKMMSGDDMAYDDLQATLVAIRSISDITS